MSAENYTWRTPQFVRDFDKSIARVKAMVIYHHGAERAVGLIRESRQEYHVLIPQIPYIGVRNPFLVFLLPTTRYLAVYRTLRRHGTTVEDAGQTAYAMGEAELKAIPRLVRRGIGSLWFSPLFLGRLRKSAAESQKRRYPGDFVFQYVQGNGRDFDYGIDYIECANCKFLFAQGASELAPYVCAVDKVASEMMKWGLTRTTTLAEGGEKCDFRFKKGGKTQVEIPRSLKHIGV